MFYDIVIVVTPELIEKYPEYLGVTHVVMATAYAHDIAKSIASILQAMSDDGSVVEIHVRNENIVNDTSFGPVYGVFTDD